MERVMGIEPTLMAWEANALPLSYTRESVGNTVITWARSLAKVAILLSPKVTNPSPQSFNK